MKALSLLARAVLLLGIFSVTFCLVSCQKKAADTPQVAPKTTQVTLDFAPALQAYRLKWMWDQMDDQQKTIFADKLFRYAQSEQANQPDSNNPKKPLPKDTCYCFSPKEIISKAEDCVKCQLNKSNIAYLFKEKLDSKNIVCYPENCILANVNTALNVIDPDEDCGNGDCFKNRMNNFRGDIDLEGPIPHWPPLGEIEFRNIPTDVTIKDVRIATNWQAGRQSFTYKPSGLSSNTFVGDIEVDFEIDNVLYTNLRFRSKQ